MCQLTPTVPDPPTCRLYASEVCEELSWCGSIHTRVKFTVCLVLGLLMQPIKAFEHLFERAAETGYLLQRKRKDCAKGL